MALGALEALRSEGLAGKVLVTGIDGVAEIFEAVQNGEAAATVYNDSKYQAGIALAIALAAKNGELDVASMPKERRQFFADALNVNKDNVDEVVNVYVNGTPEYDFEDLFASWSRAMK
jgi:ribose transport system substrate-binding protein